MIKSTFILTLLLSSINIYPQILLEDTEFSDKDFPLIILSEGFNTPAFPPPGWSREIITGSYNWSLSYNGSYCTSPNSAFIPFNISPSGQIARLISPIFVPTSTSRDSLIFSEAYCQRPGVTESLEIFISTNSGTTWQLYLSYNSSDLSTAPATSSYFTPICFQWQDKRIYLPLNTNRILFQAAGGGGNNLYIDEIIVKPSQITGIIKYSEEIPVNFSLLQNYPNPYNPSTKIRFDITVSSHVNLTVFDVTGRTISIIVNDKLNAGKYEITFSALNLPSGIYYYKLTAGGLSETRKMILLK